jgi:hypothetical protein
MSELIQYECLEGHDHESELVATLCDIQGEMSEMNKYLAKIAETLDGILANQK